MLNSHVDDRINLQFYSVHSICLTSDRSDQFLIFVTFLVEAKREYLVKSSSE